MLKFNVKNQIIERLDEFRVVGDSKNYLTADFMLSDEWDDKKVFASFSHINLGKAKEAEIKDGQCLVPWEVIKPPFFSVSLFCGDLITSNVVSVQVEPSGLEDGEPAGTPTPTVWAEYIKELERYAEELFEQQIGKRIPYGGTIFNDFINNVAAAPFTMATGSGCIAGMRGYFYSSIEFGEDIDDSGTYSPCKITLTKTQPNDITKAVSPDAFDIGFAVGDKISIINNLKYPDCATITAIESNVITVDSLPFNSIVNMSLNTSGTASDDYSVFVAEKPIAGDVPLGYGAFAGGEGATALERAAFAFGRLVKALGQYSFAANRQTVAAYCAAAFNYLTQALGDSSFAINTRTEARGTGSFTGGLGTIAEVAYQVALGKYNIIDLLNEYAMIIGGGISDSARANLFTFGWDGDLWSKGDMYFGGSNKSTAQKAICQSDVYDIIATAFATYTARELVAGITAEISLRFLYGQDDITAYSVEVDGTEIAEKTPITEKMRIASELLKAEKTRFVFYAGEEKVYTAAVKNTLPNRGMLFITE